VKKSFICFGYDEEDGGILFARFLIDEGEIIEDSDFQYITCNGLYEKPLDLMADILDSQEIDKDARLIAIQNSVSLQEFYKLCKSRIEEVV